MYREHEAGLNRSYRPLLLHADPQWPRHTQLTARGITKVDLTRDSTFVGRVRGKFTERSIGGKYI